MKALLMAGGVIDIQWAGEFLKKQRYDKIIAVDGGLSAANLLGICPDVIVGDFDTVDKDFLAQYEGRVDVEIVRLNPIKDDTDTQSAMNRLVAMKVDEIHMIGGTGGRIDHTMGNVFMLKMAYEHGIKAAMYDRTNKISVIAGNTTLYRDADYGKYISFIQLEGPAKNVTLKGFKYNVENFDFDTWMDKSYRMAISNEFVEDKATIDIGEGMFMVIEIMEEIKQR